MQALVDTACGRDRLLISVLLIAGLRISEALGLAWEDVDLRSGHLRVRYQLARNGTRVRLKTAGSCRDVVLMKSLAAKLRRHRVASRHGGNADPVFATFAGTHVSARNAGRALGHVVRTAALVGVTPHALRHTYASILISQGRDPVFVADQLGHSDPAITLRVYAHLVRAAAQEQAARNDLEAGFGHLLH